MSSVFLYIGIVAIWAFVLVPRWLHRHHAQPQAEPEPSLAAGDQDAGQGEKLVSEADDLQPELPVVHPRVRRVREPVAQPSSPRSQMVQARRRLLTLLLLLTGIAVGCAYVKVARWWVCAPPAGILIMYMMLLRVAAVADAEHARQLAAAERRAEARRYRVPEQPSVAEPAAAPLDDAAPSAEIIDISARLEDQLYDQYADATARAVGD